MFTYRVALLNALGIDYESLSELLVLQGKQYKRGPTFSKQDYLKAIEYCLMRNMQGGACILVDSSTEFTAWLHRQNSDSAETSQMGEFQTMARDQQSAQQMSESKVQMTYRGVKYFKK